MTEPLLTCEPVLAEAAFHLQNGPLVLAMVRDGRVAIAFDCREHVPQLEALALRYSDRHPDLADAPPYSLGPRALKSDAVIAIIK